MQEPVKLPSRWETKRVRTPRLTRDQLVEKLNTCTHGETDEEETTGDEANDSSSRRTVTSRSSAKKVAAMVSKFCSLKKKLVAQMGFSGILQIPQINKTDMTFTLDILKMVNCQLRSIPTDKNSQIAITPQALHRVLGIPCGQRQVCGMEDDSVEEKLDFLRICIGTGRDDDEDSDDGKIYDSLEAAEHNISREYPDGMTRVEEEQFKVSFIVFLVCRFLCPMSQPNAGSRIFWRALRDPNLVDKYNWCQLVVDNIIDSARKVQYTLARKGVVTHVDGCSLALQVLFLDHLRFGCSDKPGVPLPRISDYSCSSMSKLIQYYRTNGSPQPPVNPLLNQGLIGENKPEPTVATNIHLGKVTDVPKIHVQAQDLLGSGKADPVISLPASKTILSLKTEHDVIQTVSSYNQAVTNTKLPMRQKLALRYYMARMVTHTNNYKNAIISEGVKLVKKLDETPNSDYIENHAAATKGSIQNSSSLKVAGAPSASHVEGYKPLIPSTPRRASSLDITSCPSGTMVSKTGPADPDDPFSLGIDWEQYNKPWSDSPTIVQQPGPCFRPLIPHKDDVSHIPNSTNSVLYANKGYNSDPETSRSSRLTPFSSNRNKPSLLWTTPTNLYVGATGRSPSSLNRKWSESALLLRVLRVFEDDENAKLGGKSLSFEFTDTPIKKKRCTSGRIAKSPWSRLLAHWARNVVITSSFAEWLAATSSPLLPRNWVVHATPRYIEVTGTELKNMLCAGVQLSYNLFDLGVRRIVQLDKDMFSREGAQVWRTILESDFAMLVLAECTHTNNISIRTQFIGPHVTHEIKNCRMIVVPALVRENWCSYFWDMKLKLVHVVDPIYNEERSSAFSEIHEPNVSKLLRALDTCITEFFESWTPDWVDWKINYVKPLIRNAIPSQSGILTLIALRDFNGSSFSNGPNKELLTEFSQLLLHEVLSIHGNEGSLPDNFIKSKD